MNKSLWIIIAIVILAIIGYFLYSKTTPLNPVDQTQNPAATNPTTIQNTNTVNYSDSGFSPASLTVKVGDSVTWTNNSGKMMWVASNPHPTHSDYPGFDELTGVSSGASYSFTFTKTGNWSYHNHLKARDLGVITVQ